MMKELLITSLLLIMTAMNAQNFEERTIEITHNIDSITIAEKLAMKHEIEEIDNNLKEGKMSYDKATQEKNRLADYYAERIALAVNNERSKMEQIITDRVAAHVAGAVKDTIDITKNDHTIHIKIRDFQKRKKENYSEKRTTSQGVIAVGINALQSDNSELADNLDTWNSRFWEFGYTWNTRLSKTSNLAHIKYGLSLLYNNYKPKDKQVFAAIDNQTMVVNTDIDFDKNRFRNFYLNVPLFLEFDFSPVTFNENGEKRMRSHKGFRLGVGGYAGILINSKNFFKYEKDGIKVKAQEKKDFNVNNFNYGLSAYIGYKELSLYTKYDMQPMFENNLDEHNNLSVGIRWDIN